MPPPAQRSLVLPMACCCFAAVLGGMIVLHATQAEATGPRLTPALPPRPVFPPDNPWHQDISHLPTDPRSDALIAAMHPEKSLHCDFGTVYAGKPVGIPFCIVSGSQPRVPVRFRYAEESDPGPYPIPPDAPIEGGPGATGDRHVLVIDKDHWKLYEVDEAYPDGHGGWTGAAGAVFDLAANTLRPTGWTSADAAGLPIFPGLVRYDEMVQKRVIDHAIRFTVARTRRAYVFPARHFASSHTDPNLPPMGTRVRLKASVDISGFPPDVQVLLTALKKYGLILADNGSDWFVSGAPDPRWNDDELHTLRRLHGSDFEVVPLGAVVTR